MTTDATAADTKAAAADTLLSPAALRTIAEDAEMAKAREAMEIIRQREDAAKNLHAAFMEQDVHPEVAQRVMAVVRRAAEAGLHEVEVLRFPSTFCNDGGRAINSFDPEWPASLDGFAKRANAWFNANMRPLGYHLRAEIANFPNGMPGDVAIYICW